MDFFLIAQGLSTLFINWSREKFYINGSNCFSTFTVCCRHSFRVYWLRKFKHPKVLLPLKQNAKMVFMCLYPLIYCPSKNVLVLSYCLFINIIIIATNALKKRQISILTANQPHNLWLIKVCGACKHQTSLDHIRFKQVDQKFSIGIFFLLEWQKVCKKLQLES